MQRTSLVVGLWAVSAVCWGAEEGVLRAFAETGIARPVTVNSTDNSIPQFVDGDTWQTTLILTNLSNTTAYYRVFFLSSEGTPATFSFVGVGSGNTVTGQIGPGQTLELATPGTSSTLTQAWGALYNYDRPATQTGALVVPIRTGGMAIFRRRLPGLPDQEAVVPISNSFDKGFTIPFDNRNGFLSGIAIVNNTTQNGTVSLVARDNNGNILVTDSFALNSFNKVVYQLQQQYPGLQNRAGILQYTISTIGFSGLGLRFNPTGSFTSTHPLSLAP